MPKRNPITIKTLDGEVLRTVQSRDLRPPATSRRTQLRAARATRHWRDIRLQALERDGHRCQGCRRTDRLECHHLTYERLGAELLEDVAILCQRCHATRHQWVTRERKARETRMTEKFKQSGKNIQLAR
jgi:5-methylcytosine-specific restriction endonuclease McrA